MKAEVLFTEKELSLLQDIILFAHDMGFLQEQGNRTEEVIDIFNNVQDKLGM